MWTDILKLLTSYQITRNVKSEQKQMILYVLIPLINLDKFVKQWDTGRFPLMLHILNNANALNKTELCLLWISFNLS